MSKFMCYIPSTGYTKFKHDTIDSAVAEAKRLNNNLNQKVEILKVVGYIQKEPVPVVEVKTTVTLFDGLCVDDSLPF